MYMLVERLTGECLCEDDGVYFWIECDPNRLPPGIDPVILETYEEAVDLAWRIHFAECYECDVWLFNSRHGIWENYNATIRY